MALLNGGLTIPILSADPASNPDAGTVFLYAIGTSYKIKYSDGNIFTFATGISPEDVQDIVGAFITSANNKLSFAYNDAANTLVLTLNEGNVVHQNLSGAGSNTHAQIDTHLANTSNPHATTATQVGADPVGSASAAQAFAIQRSNHTGTQTAATISDLTEAVQDIVGPFVVGGSGISSTYNDASNTLTISSTITQYTDEQAQDASALMLTSATHVGVSVAYNDAGNSLAITNTDRGTTAVSSHEAAVDPHTQYLLETTAALTYAIVSRQINAGTGLTGGGDLTADRTLALANTAVTPGTYGSGAVPQFTVDAQGRITAASNGPALVIGDNFEEFSDLTPFVTTSAANQVAAQFNTTTKQTGLYRLGICWDWTINVTNADAIFSIFVDGVLKDGEFRMETSETATQNIPFSWTTYLNFATETTHTIELRARAEVAGNTVTVNRVRAEIWRAN